MCISLEESSTLSKLRGTELKCLLFMVKEANLEDLSLSQCGTLNSTVSLKDNTKSGKLMQCVSASGFPSGEI